MGEGFRFRSFPQTTSFDSLPCVVQVWAIDAFSFLQLMPKGSLQKTSHGSGI